MEIVEDRYGAGSTLITSQLLRGAPRKSCNALTIVMQSLAIETPLSSRSGSIGSA